MINQPEKNTKIKTRLFSVLMVIQIASVWIFVLSIMFLIILYKNDAEHKKSRSKLIRKTNRPN